MENNSNPGIHQQQSKNQSITLPPPPRLTETQDRSMHTVLPQLPRDDKCNLCQLPCGAKVHDFRPTSRDLKIRKTMPAEGVALRNGKLGAKKLEEDGSAEKVQRGKFPAATSPNGACFPRGKVEELSTLQTPLSLERDVREFCHSIYRWGGQKFKFHQSLFKMGGIPILLDLTFRGEDLMLRVSTLRGGGNSSASCHLRHSKIGTTRDFRTATETHRRNIDADRAPSLNHGRQSSSFPTPRQAK